MTPSAKRLINISLRDRVRQNSVNICAYIWIFSARVYKTTSQYIDIAHCVSKIFLLINMYKLPWINILNIV